MKMLYQFIRGGTFSVLLSVPSSLSSGFFKDWSVKSQIRIKNAPTNKNLIGEFECSWVDPDTTQTLHLYMENTDHWPVCIASIDVVFTSPAGEKVRSKIVDIHIKDEISQ